VGSDLDFLLRKKTLDLLPLTIHKPTLPVSPHISHTSARNISVRRKQNRGSIHFHGRKNNPINTSMDHFLIDIPITNLSSHGPLRAR